MINQTRKGLKFSTAIALASFIIISGLLLNVTSALAFSSHSGFSTKIENQAMLRLEKVDCSAFKGLDVSGAIVQCGYLIVPENRSNPQSRTIKVAYAIIKARGSNPQPDPVVYLTGGPGDNAIKWISDFSGKPMGEKRDILLVDPRGLGYSQPTMQCPMHNLPGIITQDTAPTAEDILAQDVHWARSCRDLLASQGFDLTAYNTIASAGDLSDLRQALGYSQWNLYGISYGTRLALVTMRAFPEGIRSVVLDSVIPPQVDRIWHGDLTSTAGSFFGLICRLQGRPGLRPRLSGHRV
jgi:pimeloyl-ACP methyl ester carboxylesterase